jgi:hypothetical protein
MLIMKISVTENKKISGFQTMQSRLVCIEKFNGMTSVKGNLQMPLWGKMVNASVSYNMCHKARECGNHLQSNLSL